MLDIAIVNKSTIVSDLEGSIITKAINMLLPAFCSDWALKTPTCTYVAKGKTTKIAIKVFLMDTSDQDGALAYHDEINNVPYGKAFAKTVLKYGGGILVSKTKVPTFAQSVCHEVFEILVDPNCNLWAMAPDYTTLIAYEVGDAVESNPVRVRVPTGTSRKSVGFSKSTITYTDVDLSDWVLPLWFDPQAKKGKFNHTNTLKGPMTLDKNGYAVTMSGGDSKTIYGAMVTPEQKKRMDEKVTKSCRTIPQK